MLSRSDAVQYLVQTPYKLGHMLGFDRLTELHNGWIRQMVLSQSDRTLQAHRGSYKTTCVSLALCILMVLYPSQRILFMRKTDADVKEVIGQVRKMLEAPQVRYLARCIWGVDLKMAKASAVELSTSLVEDIKGTAQLTGRGTNGSITGKHYDIIFTDDIINVEDRTSRAERDRTKLVYQELQNIKNRGGRIYNTGTPWHKEDAFCLMPEPETYDCYSTGLIDTETLDVIRSRMTASLFAANYEMRHIASDSVIFGDPQTGFDMALAEQGICHIDAAYGGEDYTAFTVVHKVDGFYYAFGKIWQRHVDDCLPEIIGWRQKLNAGKIFCEDNGDKGYLAKELRRRGERAVAYHEDTNKFLKITSYLKAEWSQVRFVNGTDKAYIEQVADYTEDAEHDDAPDSLSCLVRQLWRKSDEKYTPMWG